MEIIMFYITLLHTLEHRWRFIALDEGSSHENCGLIDTRILHVICSVTEVQLLFVISLHRWKLKAGFCIIF